MQRWRSRKSERLIHSSAFQGLALRCNSGNGSNSVFWGKRHVKEALYQSADDDLSEEGNEKGHGNKGGNVRHPWIALKQSVTPPKS